ncbi:MAG: RNA polymerase sigma-70 factor [Tannerellaceae bacterium]|jgi:RNA polymerase sigma-70 factor (ECF subfamily)|nr:RNA polymerase sigma-70 factor [Tannerellaceae bacterium]
MNHTDSITFNAIYQQLYRRAFSFTKSYVHNDLTAEDIASEAIVVLWEQSKEKEIKNPEAFLLAILKNKALDYLKHEIIKEEAFTELSSRYAEDLQLRISLLEACDPSEVFETEIQKIVQDTLARFPEQSRLIFEMCRYGDKSNKEIAQELGLSVKSIEYHITKVLKALRIALKDYLPLFYFLFPAFFRW